MKRRTAERNLQNKTGSNNESKTTIMTNAKHGDRGKRTQVLIKIHIVVKLQYISRHFYHFLKAI